MTPIPKIETGIIVMRKKITIEGYHFIIEVSLNISFVDNVSRHRISIKCKEKIINDYSIIVLSDKLEYSIKEEERKIEKRVKLLIEKTKITKNLINTLRNMGFVKPIKK